ncbi:MAG TPA: proton-conducting transporter membrane subunit [Chitinophagales bacterium]|nr:proton-conducting transporter membrane subunit [Chitinophagales bacterium]
MLQQYLPYFALIPLIGLVLSLLPNNKQERLIFGLANATIITHIALALVFTIAWFMQPNAALSYKSFYLYKGEDANLFLDYYFDRMTLFYGVIASAIVFMVSRFSRYYMHREKGFKRFFNNLLAFYLGVNLIIIAGNFETMFIGWEIIGISSFFLIAFYRDRYLPVKNALKVFSVYRIADVFFLLAIWSSHHLFGKSITFIELPQLLASGIDKIQEHPVLFALLPINLLVVAMVKSAQLPFSSWLPRAMEGPTTSSAVFYGSLSVHIGVFLLMRTYPLWEANMAFKIAVVAIGLLTAFISGNIARVQSSVKTQIAYSSISQIGLMFAEVALGWHTLALLHFTGNAFLRTYQLLVSPSVLSYLIHDQFFNFIPPQHPNPHTVWGKVQLTLYAMGIKEWNLDWFLYRFLWSPPKKIGLVFRYLNSMALLVVFTLVFAGGLYASVSYYEQLPEMVERFLPEIFALIGVIVALKAFTERNSALIALSMVVLNQLFTALSINFNEHFTFNHILLYLSGIIVSGVIAFACLQRLKQEGEPIDLNDFQGHSYERPRLTLAFMLACLGLSGFPITPTFIGEDLILGHIHENQIPLTTLTALSLILVGLATMRMYARLFWGPHKKGYHEVAYRSS